MKLTQIISRQITATDASNASTLFGWGEPLFRSEARKWMNAAILLSFAALAICFSALTVALLVEFVEKRDYGAWFLILFCMLVTLGSLKLMLWRWRSRNDWVAVYEDGVGAQYNGKELAIPWAEIEAVVQNLQTLRVNLIPIKIRNFIVTSKSGGNYIFGNTLKEIEAVGSLMQQCATARLLPQAIEAYERGEPLAFSNLTIDQSGLHLKKKSLLWSELESVKLGNGMLAFRRQGKRLNWAALNTNLTPNVFVFFGLLKHVGKM